ncbi:MAG: hypothetical protein HZB79_09910 [Deltaproteobacteria bacterium]|nr:hypothetical protein [Deltaproteobacteria bacterium]
MSEKKEPVEIECPECHAKFRVWVPAKLLPKWNEGEEIGCIKCKTSLHIKKQGDVFNVQSMKEIEASKEEAGKEKVLVVDDDALVRKMTEDMLIGIGVKPMLVKNAEEALSALEKTNISAIISDLHLKNPNDPHSLMDGEEFLGKVVAMGKKELIDDLVLNPKWYDLNVKGFIQKGNPFWMDELVVKIKELLKKD